MSLIDSFQDKLAEDAFPVDIVFPMTDNKSEAVLNETEVDDLEI